MSVRTFLAIYTCFVAVFGLACFGMAVSVLVGVEALSTHDIPTQATILAAIGLQNILCAGLVGLPLVKGWTEI